MLFLVLLEFDKDFLLHISLLSIIYQLMGYGGEKVC